MLVFIPRFGLFSAATALIIELGNITLPVSLEIERGLVWIAYPALGSGEYVLEY